MSSGTKQTLSVIVARSRNRAIGKGNGLLWRLPRDLQHFKQTTLGAPIIMGRKTWDSIGRPLPGRRNIVVTRQAGWTAPGAETAASLADALERASRPQEPSGAVAPKAFVIGGAEIYAQALPLADEVIATEIEADFDADAFFPPLDDAMFEQVSRSDTFEENGLRYRFVSYVRRP